MDLEEEIDRINVWAFVRHNQENIIIVRGLRNLTIRDFDGYFLDVWRYNILTFLEKLEKRVRYFAEKLTQKNLPDERRKRFEKNIKKTFEDGYESLSDEIASMSVYAFDQDSLGPIAA